ncbi:MAG TPA: hypothetical protein VIA80_18755 [Hyphomonadaceae bacterium]|jgi:hypothetical protein
MQSQTAIHGATPDFAKLTQPSPDSAMSVEYARIVAANPYV